VLESHARRENLNYSSFERVLDAVEKAKAEADPSDLILVFGSIFLLSDLKTIILASDNLEA
jgi:folylpolyglutamate synthase/dihydropteroate synthase